MGLGEFISMSDDGVITPNDNAQNTAPIEETVPESAPVSPAPVPVVEPAPIIEPELVIESAPEAVTVPYT